MAYMITNECIPCGAYFIECLKDPIGAYERVLMRIIKVKRLGNL